MFSIFNSSSSSPFREIKELEREQQSQGAADMEGETVQIKSQLDGLELNSLFDEFKIFQFSII